MKNSFRECPHVNASPHAMASYLMLEHNTLPMRTFIGVALCEACTVKATAAIDAMELIDRTFVPPVNV